MSQKRLKIVDDYVIIFNRASSSPWGNFKVTWELPDKISKDDAFEKSEKQEEKENRCNNKEYKDQEHHEYTPGDLTDPYQQHPSREILLTQKRNKSHNIEPQYELNDLYLEKSNSPVHKDHTDHHHDHNNHYNHRHTKQSHILGENIEPLNVEKEMTREVTEKPGESNATPIIPAYCNFQVARKMHAENLDHQPLPDSIMDRAYRKLQAQGFANPELALDVCPIATGVGVKTYMAGPTHCTKLKVFRPKTCGVVPKPLDKSMCHSRPHTSGGKVKMAPMDLAICWDYRPLNPRDEPKRPTHIDGSNGSAAPAVFTLVKTPRTPEPNSGITEPNTGRSSGVFCNTFGEETFFDKDIMRRNYQFGSKPDLVRTCTCETSAANWDNAKTNRQNSSQHRRCKSSPNLSQIANASEAVSVHEENRRTYHQCSKQQRHEHGSHPRKCTTTQKSSHRLCEQNVVPISCSVQRKPEYKSAFKAGIPKSNSSCTCTSFDSGCSSMSSSCSSKSTLKVPKPRNPYSKKNYVIDTLAPPFACSRGGAGQGGYPEHYHLASVYQHAYKPVEQRKRPLLATVYQ